MFRADDNSSSFINAYYTKLKYKTCHCNFQVSRNIPRTSETHVKFGTPEVAAI